jgi:CheY-like chemotaxis protein
MPVITCLLVSDDPDDHQGFSEASSEIAEDAIVLTILDSQKAVQFLKATPHRFDLIFLDLSMQGIRINMFLKSLKDDLQYESAKIIVYGEEVEFFRIEDPTGITFFKKDYEYSELRHFLKDFFTPRVQ